MTQSQKRAAICFVAALFLFCSPSLFAAEGGGLGDRAKSITNDLQGFLGLIGNLSYLVGAGFALTGMLQFKAHKDNPQQTPLSKPIVLLLVAAGLVGLPSVINLMKTAIVGDSTAKLEMPT